MNGRYSYVVFNQGFADYSALAVFEGSRKISEKACKSGPGFMPRWNENTEPPDDPLLETMIDGL